MTQTKLTAKVIVNAKEWNHSSNVLFMMRSDDERLSDPDFKDNYELVTTGIARREKVTLTAHRQRPVINATYFYGDNGITYQIYSDWSAKARQTK